jgi:hypothetical protein
MNWIIRLNRFYIFLILFIVILLTLPYGILTDFQKTVQFSYEDATKMPIQPFTDHDGDLINETVETTVTFTDPGCSDTDMDGMPDGAEYEYWNERYESEDFLVTQDLRDIYPYMDETQLGKQFTAVGDLDGDGLTNILDRDSDNDRLPDGWEKENDYDPGIRADISDPAGLDEVLQFLGKDYSEIVDSDDDKLPDDWEEVFDCRLPFGDSDLDGMSNLEEYLFGTNPNAPGQGMIDFDPFGSREMFVRSTYRDYYLDRNAQTESEQVLNNDQYYFLVKDYYRSKTYDNARYMSSLPYYRYDENVKYRDHEDYYYSSSSSNRPGEEIYKSRKYTINTVNVEIPRDREDNLITGAGDEDFGRIRYKSQDIDVDYYTVNSSSKIYLESPSLMWQDYYNGMMLDERGQDEQELFQVSPPSTQRYWTLETYSDSYVFERNERPSQGWSQDYDQYGHVKWGEDQAEADLQAYDITINGCSNGYLPVTTDTDFVFYYRFDYDVMEIDMDKVGWSRYDRTTSLERANYWYHDGQSNGNLWNYTLNARHLDIDLGLLRSDQFNYDLGTAEFSPFIPFDIKTSVTTEVEEITKDAQTDIDKCLEIQKYVLTSDLSSIFGDAGGVSNWTAQDFATAFVLMARQVEIPCRMNVGYGPGTLVDGRRVVRNKDAHAWVEVRFRGSGWVPLEVTPLRNLTNCPFTAGSDVSVISYDPDSDGPFLGGSGPVVIALESDTHSLSVQRSSHLDADFDSVPNDQDNDMDGDGIPNDQEGPLRTDLLSYDTDGDGISDYDEVYVHYTNPLNPDSDNDGLGDIYEVTGEEPPEVYRPLVKVRFFFERSGNMELQFEPYLVDRDRDFVFDDIEAALGLDSRLADSDGDLIPDGIELYLLYSDPLDKDSDSDGALDYFEAMFGSSLYMQDTDGDELSDSNEINAHIFRLPKTAAYMADTDGDLIPDNREHYKMLQGKDPAPPPEPPPDPVDDDIDDDWPEFPEPGWGFELGGIPVSMLLMILIPLLLAIIIAIILIRQKPPEDEILDIIERTRRRLEKTKDVDKIREIIIECYKAMCAVFAKQGIPRLDSETVNEFRVAMETIMPIKKKPLDELTALFEVARYSDHKLKFSTRRRAINALDGVRSEILRIKRTGRMKGFRTKRFERLKRRGTVQERELIKRRAAKSGLVVFHQDMTQEAQQAYFLKELQRSNEERYDKFKELADKDRKQERPRGSGDSDDDRLEADVLEVLDNEEPYGSSGRRTQFDDDDEWGGSE